MDITYTNAGTKKSSNSVSETGAPKTTRTRTRKPKVELPPPPPPKPIMFARIEKAMKKLDKALATKIALVFGIYFSIIAACSVGFAINNALPSSAASGAAAVGGGASVALNTWILATVAVFTFFALLVLVYYFSRKKQIKASK